MREGKIKRGKELAADDSALLARVEAATPAELDRVLDAIDTAPDVDPDDIVIHGERFLSDWDG
jgi:hypothetical protein